MASFLTICDSSIDYALKQILKEVKTNRRFCIGPTHTRRQLFLTHLATSLQYRYPGTNIVIVRHGQTHQVKADAVKRKVQGPLPGLTDYLGLTSHDYIVYVCRRGSFVNFGHGGPNDIKWAGNVTLGEKWGHHGQTLMLR